MSLNLLMITFLNIVLFMAYVFRQINLWRYFCIHRYLMRALNSAKKKYNAEHDRSSKMYLEYIFQHHLLQFHTTVQLTVASS